MGNGFSNIKADNAFFIVSNGGTDVLFDTLSLSSSSIAKNDWEKHLACWFAGHDQRFLGRGIAGSDIDDIGWTKEDFNSEKSFILRCINLAKSKYRWNELEYPPGNNIFTYLEEFETLVQLYQKGFLENNNIWSDKLVEGNMKYTLCPEHKVYIHIYGCRFCTTILTS